jgi:hypothetical protein
VRKQQQRAPGQLELIPLRHGSSVVEQSEYKISAVWLVLLKMMMSTTRWRTLMTRRSAAGDAEAVGWAGSGAGVAEEAEQLDLMMMTTRRRLPGSKGKS